MKREEDFTAVKAIVTYKSGRTEEFHGKLNKNNLPDARFQKKVADMKRFPTVIKVHTEKY